MAAYPTKLLEAFATKVLQRYYQRSVAEKITNNDYEGEVKDRASIVNILTFGALDAKNYTGADLTADDLTEVNGQLVTNQAKAFYFTVKNYDTFRSYIKNPEGTILDQIANRMKQIIDNFILSLWTKVAAGQRIGTDYTTGTVTVDAVTGNVTGSGTTFTSAMVGKPFKATGHSLWYRVKTYNSATSIVIEDDKDDETSAYTGGAIGAGATYTIQAVTAMQLTKSNVYDTFVTASTMLDDAEIPEEDRFAVVSPYVAGLIVKSTEYISAGTESGREEAVKRGYIGMFAGFRVYKASALRIAGDAVNGWHIICGHRSAITYAMALTENAVEKDIIGNFGKRFKMLFVYGAKVLDERRKCLVEIYAKQ